MQQVRWEELPNTAASWSLANPGSIVLDDLCASASGGDFSLSAIAGSLQRRIDLYFKKLWKLGRDCWRCFKLLLRSNVRKQEQSWSGLYDMYQCSGRGSHGPMIHLTESTITPSEEISTHSRRSRLDPNLWLSSISGRIPSRENNLDSRKALIN